MSHYAIYCRDKAGAGDQRQAASPAHLMHVEEHLENYFIAGPIKDNDGATVGSLLIVKADSADKARNFLEQDPYFSADIWESIEIHDFMPAAGDWIGGKIW
ncbi:MAG: YciI family protein [Parasphingorhabdus sp.]